MRSALKQRHYSHYFRAGHCGGATNINKNQEGQFSCKIPSINWMRTATDCTWNVADSRVMREWARRFYCSAKEGLSNWFCYQFFYFCATQVRSRGSQSMYGKAEGLVECLFANSPNLSCCTFDCSERYLYNVLIYIIYIIVCAEHTRRKPASTRPQQSPPRVIKSPTCQRSWQTIYLDIHIRKSLIS